MPNLTISKGDIYFKMSWSFPWSDFVKKRACRYLLQHYLGQFLKEKLTLDQLSVDLYKGTGIIKQLDLDVKVCMTLLHKFYFKVTRKVLISNIQI